MPALLAQGRPIGLRIAYDAQFSETGLFNPAVGVEGKNDNERWRSRTRMEVLDSTITPMPREAFPPFGPVILNDIRTSPLQSGATYRYEAGKVYHFTADLVPDFAIHNLDRNKVCIYYPKRSSRVGKAIRGDIDLRGPDDILGPRGRPHGPYRELLE